MQFFCKEIVSREINLVNTVVVSRYFTSFWSKKHSQYVPYAMTRFHQTHLFSSHQSVLFLRKISLTCRITPKQFSLFKVDPKEVFFSTISLTVMTFSSIETVGEQSDLQQLLRPLQTTYITHEPVDVIYKSQIVFFFYLQAQTSVFQHHFLDFGNVLFY